MNRLRNILIVVALALTCVAATARVGMAATAWNLVAMGDSITSGEGTYSYLSSMAYLSHLAAALDGAYQDIRNGAPNATVAVPIS